MAERRMFSKTIIDSDTFLDMSLSAQALYFHLSMRADDEGFINNPKKTQRMLGASDDDLKILILKKFIIPFDSGIVVIRHWKIHNYIQSDRFHETTYLEEKSMLYIDKKKMYTERIQDKYEMDTQDRLDKDRLDKDRLGKNNTPSISPSTSQNIEGVKEKQSKKKSEISDELFERFWKVYPRKVGKKKAKEAFIKIKPNEELVNFMVDAIDKQKRSLDWKKNDGQYIPNPTTWLNQGRWDDELRKDPTDHSASIEEVERENAKALKELQELAEKWS